MFRATSVPVASQLRRSGIWHLFQPPNLHTCRSSGAWLATRTLVAINMALLWSLAGVVQFVTDSFNHTRQLVCASQIFLRLILLSLTLCFSWVLRHALGTSQPF